MYMKKSELYLFKTASKFQTKYAQSQSLKEIIENAASYGDHSANGIMNFSAQLKRDQADLDSRSGGKGQGGPVDLSLTITVSSGMMGGLSAEVAPPTVTPSQYAPNYAKLPEQIKKYLDRHLKDFPQIPQGPSTIQYTGKEIQEPDLHGIARR